MLRDSRLTLIAFTDGEPDVWITEFPQNVDVFLGMDKHHIRLWVRGKGRTVVSYAIYFYTCAKTSMIIYIMIYSHDTNAHTDNIWYIYCCCRAKMSDDLSADYCILDWWAYSLPIWVYFLGTAHAHKHTNTQTHTHTCTRTHTDTGVCVSYVKSIDIRDT